MESYTVYFDFYYEKKLYTLCHKGDLFDIKLTINEEEGERGFCWYIFQSGFVYQAPPFFQIQVLVRDVANTPSLLSSTIPIFSNLDTFLYHII